MGRYWLDKRYGEEDRTERLNRMRYLMEKGFLETTSINATLVHLDIGILSPSIIDAHGMCHIQRRQKIAIKSLT